MKIAVLGVSGMLGSMLADYLSRDFEVVGTNRRNFPALNPDWRIIEGCEWVINAIGAIPQRYKSKNTMIDVNAIFPYRLSLHANKVIQIATDCVFSGREGNYTELDKHDYHNNQGILAKCYGQSKHLGEIKNPNFYNLRCSIIGLEPQGCYSLLSKFVACQDRTMQGYTNHYWNGLTTLAFAQICKGIMETKFVNVLPNMQHIVPADWVSKYQLLKIAGEAFNRDIEIVPIQQGAGIVDRRLATVRPEVNRLLWELAGYAEPPSIQQMVKELAEYKARVAV